MCKVRTPQPEALLLLLLAALGSAPLAVAMPTNFILVMADGEWQPSGMLRSWGRPRCVRSRLAPTLGASLAVMV